MDSPATPVKPSARPAVISDGYRRQQQELHKNPHYGEASLGYAKIVHQLMKGCGARSLSDYGAGKRNLARALVDLGLDGFEYFPYDPAFPEYGEPRPADLVTCIDVLEHIEPEHLQNVMAELRGLVKKLGFFTIHMGPAVKVLPDGRNAHLIQRPASWWLPVLCQHFEVVHLESIPDGFWVVVKARSG